MSVPTTLPLLNAQFGDELDIFGLFSTYENGGKKEYKRINQIYNVYINRQVHLEPTYFNSEVFTMKTTVHFTRVEISMQFGL